MQREKMHDYSGVRVPAANPGKRTRSRGVGADTKNISVVRAAAGVCKWATVGGVAYPKPVKTTYGVGETVYIDFAWTNTGGATATGIIITVIDNDTGKTVWAWPAGVPLSTGPGVTAYLSGQEIGKMPDKSAWSLRCDITP